MGECGFCGREMQEADSCTKNAINLPAPGTAAPHDAGSLWHAVPFGDGTRAADRDIDPDDRCHDCGVAVGGYHHPGCDMEEAPFHEVLDTHDQLLSVVIGAHPTSAPRHAHVEADGHADISFEEIAKAQRDRERDRDD